ncbi:ubiquitin C-terminal hydrolase Ubp14, partial [Dimargaris verticillata]
FLHDELGLTVPAPALFKKRPNKCLTLDGTNPFYPLLDAAFAQRFQNQLSKAVGAAKTGNEVPGDLGYGHDAVEHFFQHLKSLPPDVNAMALRQYLDEVSEDRAMRTDGTQPHGFTYLTALDTMNNTSLLRLAEIIGQFARYLKVAQTVPDAAPFTPADQLQVLHRFTYKYLLCQWSETKLIQWDTQLAAILKIPDKTLSADLVYSMVFADMVAMLKVQDVPGIMELHATGFSLAPQSSPTIYKDECTLCFETPDSPQGIDVCLTCFNGGCQEILRHGDLHYAKHQHPLALNIQRTPKQPNESPKPAKITKLAIQEEQLDYDRYDHRTSIHCYACQQMYAVQGAPESVAQAVTLVMITLSATKKSEIKSWEEEEPTGCSHTSSLTQTPPVDQAGLPLTQCRQCDLTANLWLCLACGYVGCGRRQFDGSGGNDHGVQHYQETGHPVSCKLGTITPEGTADIYCYACDDARVDPHLANHLATFGISVATAQKTDKSMVELQLEKNAQFDFSMTTADGHQLTPVFGPGLTGLSNLGNSCYMGAALQCVLALPAFQNRYYPMVTTHVQTCSLPPATCFFCQFAKLADGMLSGRYSHPTKAPVPSDEAHDSVRGQDGIKPHMFKQLIGGTHPEFSTMRQQDAYEFFGHLLKVTEQKERAQDHGQHDPSQEFCFQLEERLECLTCHRVRYSTQTANSLSVPIPLAANGDSTAPVTLTQCLDALTADETVDGYRCPHCQAPTQVTKRQRLATFPLVLAVHLQRFRIVNWVPRKVDTPVIVPPDPTNQETVNLEPYRGHGRQPHEEAMPEETPSAPSATTPAVNPEELAQLVSMGFPEVRCRKALINAHPNGVEVAMNWLLEHMDDPDIDDPLPEPAASVQPTAAIPTVDEGAVGMLVDMGFSRAQATRALQATDQQMERAVEWLFNHPDGGADEEIDSTPTAAAAVATTSMPTNPMVAAGDAPDATARQGMYNLASCVSHKGTSVHCGHYVAHVWHPERRHWVLFNDNKVVEAPEPPLAEAFLYFFRCTDSHST